MENIFLQKNFHLEAFDEKRELHKKTAFEIYDEFMKNTQVDKSNHMLLFSSFYEYFTDKFPAEIYADEIIVGTNWHWHWQDYGEDKAIIRNCGHFTPDFEEFLQKGVEGKLLDIYNTIPQNDEEKINKECFEKTLKTFSAYIKKYSETACKLMVDADDSEKVRLKLISDTCEHISKKPPATFRQALQFTWFIQAFLETEACNAAISFGRLDKYLYPYYLKDIECGSLTRDEALKLVMSFYIKASEGDEAQMITLGGDIDNELTHIFIDAQTEINLRQPSIALRVSEKTRPETMDKAKALAETGSGMPAFFNDSVIISGMKKLKFNDEVSSDYVIVGCYEAAPYGIFSDTVACAFNLYDSFGEFLDTAGEYGNYKDFIDGYKTFFKAYYREKIVPLLQKNVQRDRAQTSPFASCVLKKFSKNLLVPMNDEEETFLYGINVLGIGVLIDSIYTVKKLVFDKGYTTVDYLNEQASLNFTDEDLYAEIKEIKTYFGSNDEESNALAREISEFIGNVMLSEPIGKNVIVSPSLFWFTADINQRNYQGSVNGRRSGELLSYGIMPCASPHNPDILEALISAANIACEYFPDGCPAMINLVKEDMQKDGIFSSLIETYFQHGGAHLAMNIVDADVLRKAQSNPDEYSNLIIKISGHSTYFIRLSDNMQEALISRAERGL